MLIIAAFMRATALVIAGYFVWYTSSKAEDRLKTVGKYIAIWTFAFAAVLMIIGVVGAVMRPMGMHGRPGMIGPRMGMGMGMGGPGMHMGMRGGMGFEGQRPRMFFRHRGEGPDAAKKEDAAPAAPAPVAKP